MTHHQTGEEIRLIKAKQAKTEALLNSLQSNKAKLRLIAAMARAKRSKERSFK